MDQHSSNPEKVAFFRSMFVGRKNAFARRFESAKTGKNGMKVVRLLLEYCFFVPLHSTTSNYNSLPLFDFDS